MVLYSGYNTINWSDTNHFDSEDDYHTGCRNVSHCQQQSYSGLRSPGRSNSTYFWIVIDTCNSPFIHTSAYYPLLFIQDIRLFLIGLNYQANFHIKLPLTKLGRCEQHTHRYDGILPQYTIATSFPGSSVVARYASKRNTWISDLQLMQKDIAR